MRDVNAILFAVNRGFKRYMNARQEFLAFRTFPGKWVTFLRSSM